MEKRVNPVMFPVILTIIGHISLGNGLPVLDKDQTATTTVSSNDSAPQDLYVIKTLVYEVGILTDADNDTDSDNSTEISHQVDLTFFDPAFNGSQIDLSRIPLPVQTNISGLEVTGFAAADLGSIVVPPAGETVVHNASDLPIGVPILPNALVTVSHNISTTNPEKSASLVEALPKVLGLNVSTTESTLANGH